MIPPRAAALFLSLFLFPPFSLFAQESFRYRHNAGDQWHLNVTVTEDVLMGDELLYETEILNRIAVEVLQGNGQDGLLGVSYSIAERGSGADVYRWAAEYETRYARDTLGRLSGIEAGSVLPSVRDIPVFPERPLAPGDRWTYSGREVVDLNASFGLDEILTFDFPVNYQYIGVVEQDDRVLHQIQIAYGYSWSRTALDLPIVQVEGRFDQKLLWDEEAGRAYAVEDAFSMTYVLEDGRSFTFRGLSQGSAVYATELDGEALAQEIEDAAGQDGSVVAEAVDGGVRVSLEDVHFYPDSPELLPGEEGVLVNIAEVLQRYPDRDILIVGHTADVGNGSDGVVLSERRADTVARYFLSLGIRDARQVLTRGMGSSQPVASNANEAGRRRNRRVEIFIMEN